MIKLTAECDYVVGDTDAWLADMSSPNEEAQESFDAFLEATQEYYDGNAIMPWLESLDGDVTGLYGDGKPFTGVSCNEDNWLSDDVMVTLAHTEQFGDLLIWQYGIYLGATVHVCSFDSMEDADAYSWSGGSAGHADGSECDSEWIIASACILWPNGGRGETHRMWDLPTNDKGQMLCPDHGAVLAFVGY